MTGVLIRRVEETQTHLEREHHLMMEPEAGVVHPQAEAH